MGLVERAGLRYDARMTAHARALPSAQATDQVAIPLPAAIVWEFTWRAENAPLTSDNIIEGFTVPGSPVGEVGEVQCHIVRTEGDLLVGSLVEVVELDPGRRAVTRSLSTREAAISTTEVVPAGSDASVLRVSHAMTVTNGKDRKVQAALSEHVQTYVARVADVLRAQHPNGVAAGDGDNGMAEAD